MAVQVECSKSGKHQAFCDTAPVEGFPTLVVYRDGLKKKYEGGRCAHYRFARSPPPPPPPPPPLYGAARASQRMPNDREWPTH